MENAEQTRRRARRIRWTVRLVFYPGAALIAFVLLKGASGDVEDGSPLLGQTDQDREIRIWLADRVVVLEEATVAVDCGSGRPHTIDVLSFSFRRHGDVVAGRRDEVETLDADGRPYRRRSELTFDAEVDADTVRGRLTYRLTTRWVDDPRRYACASGPVAFFATVPG